MSYQEFTNFTEYVANNVDKVKLVGFGIVDFIGNHKMGTAIFFIIIFILVEC